MAKLSGNISAVLSFTLITIGAFPSIIGKSILIGERSTCLMKIPATVVRLKRICSDYVIYTDRGSLFFTMNNLVSYNLMLIIYINHKFHDFFKMASNVSSCYTEEDTS